MPNKKMRGQGGVAVMYKEELKTMISVCKTDAYKRYIWIKIETGPKTKPMYIAGCYIPHRESPFYCAFNVEKNSPFEDLYADVNKYAQEGNVMLMGDMNARIGHAQMQVVDLLAQIDITNEWNEKDVTESMWERCSKDLVTNPQGIALLSLLTSMQLVVLNGTQCFENSGDNTCYTANKGMSTIDYALIDYRAAHIVQKFKIGDRSPNSDHTPIHAWIKMQASKGQAQPQTKTWKYNMRTDKKKEYAKIC